MYIWRCRKLNKWLHFVEFKKLKLIGVLGFAASEKNSILLFLTTRKRKLVF